RRKAETDLGGLGLREPGRPQGGCAIYSGPRWLLHNIEKNNRNQGHGRGTASAATREFEVDSGAVVDAIRADLLEEYLQPHEFPWIIGYSGGKDSTLVTHLVFEMLMALPPSKRQ